jgi:hypothetical protein
MKNLVKWRGIEKIIKDYNGVVISYLTLGGVMKKKIIYLMLASF